MSVIYVNGRFLGRAVTGVERFARMVLDRVDASLSSCGANCEKWVILAPRSVAAQNDWPNIEFRTVGRLEGHLWEQFELSWHSRDGMLVNLCNSGPVVNKRALTIIHDAAVYDFPENFSRPYRLLHQNLGRLLARRSTIGTVSHFSRGELSARLRIDPQSISVIPNAADHIDAIEIDDSPIASLGLDSHPYLLFVGSFAPNKNLRRALEAFARAARPNERLVLVGAAVKSFAANGLASIPDNVILPGRIPDPQLMALYRSARALVFPSLYEGFGIPPLEAMRFGCPVLASDIPPLREVCGPAALYFDPLDVDALAGQMRRILDDDALGQQLRATASTQGQKYSWASSANMLRRSIASLM